MKTKLKIIVAGIILFLLFPACKKELFDELGLITDDETEMENTESIEISEDDGAVEFEVGELQEMKITVVVKHEEKENQKLENTIINQDRIQSIDPLIFDPASPDDWKIFQY